MHSLLQGDGPVAPEADHAAHPTAAAGETSGTVPPEPNLLPRLFPRLPYMISGALVIHRPHWAPSSETLSWPSSTSPTETVTRSRASAASWATAS